MVKYYFIYFIVNMYMPLFSKHYLKTARLSFTLTLDLIILDIKLHRFEEWMSGQT